MKKRISKKELYLLYIERLINIISSNITYDGKLPNNTDVDCSDPSISYIAGLCEMITLCSFTKLVTSKGYSISIDEKFKSEFKAFLRKYLKVTYAPLQFWFTTYDFTIRLSFLIYVRECLKQNKIEPFDVEDYYESNDSIISRTLFDYSNSLSLYRLKVRIEYSNTDNNNNHENKN